MTGGFLQRRRGRPTTVIFVSAAAGKKALTKMCDGDQEEVEEAHDDYEQGARAQDAEAPKLREHNVN